MREREGGRSKVTEGGMGRGCGLVCFVFSTDSVEEDKMLAEGVSRFCEDAGLDPTSLTVLIIAWKFRAATQCEFSRKEFVDGMTSLG